MKKYFFYKNEIKGLKDVAETARVIEKSAGAYIHFFKKRVASLSDYKNQINTALKRLIRFYFNPPHPLLLKKEGKNNALLVITGNKGIVGELYHNIINEVLNKKGVYNYIWVIGEKGNHYLKEENVQVNELFNLENLSLIQKVKEINRVILKRFQNNSIKKIDILYPKFFSLAEQKPTTIQFLPFNFVLDSIPFSRDINRQDGFPLFEPSKKLVFDALIKKYIDVFFAEIILESKLSELAARTVTAESAVKETKRLISLFTRKFLKEKHLTITQKQVESFNVHQIL